MTLNISQLQALLALVALFAIVAVLTLVGVFSGHNGLFQLAGDAFKTVLGAVIGALTSLFARSDPTVAKK